MKTKYIRIYSINDATNLVKMAVNVEGDVTISRGKYVVDAKSLLGVISIDVSSGVTINYPEAATEFDQYISQFELNDSEN